ncbi:MAG TPA: type II toxin-antitoxin system VapC family toxin [Chthoniobacterales bacterium]|nr:type II toxin-antitoxin system VapC family toxin [Chthoniobacterales bacterium]
MRGLIDTHALLFALASSKSLSLTAKNFLRDRQNEAFVSVVSFWEVSLKVSLGKLSLSGISPDEIPRYALSMGLAFLPLTADTACTFHQLPKIGKHRDPFDRMIAWQAIREDLVLVSRDRAMSAYETYGLSLVW